MHFIKTFRLEIIIVLETPYNFTSFFHLYYLHNYIEIQHYIQYYQIQEIDIDKIYASPGFAGFTCTELYI